MDQHCFGSPARYQIRIQGVLSDDWGCRLSGMKVVTTSAAEGQPFTTLTGELVDQTALLGVLNTLHDLCFSLLSVTCLPASEPNLSTPSAPVRPDSN